MADASQIKPHFEVIGADGVPLGRVERVEEGRFRLDDVKGAGGEFENQHRYVPIGLVADVEGDKVRLSASAAVAVLWEEDRAGDSIA